MSTRDDEFDALVTESLGELPPPDEVTKSVTPWSKAMNYVLCGLALTSITLNFYNLDSILPMVGIVAYLLGFRALRRENRAFAACFAISALRCAIFVAVLIMRTTIYGDEIFPYLSAVELVLNFALLWCLWLAFRAVRRRAGLKPGAGAVLGMMLWLAACAALALISYMGLIIGAAMIVLYALMIRSIMRLSRELDEAGYEIAPTTPRMSNRALTLCILGVLAAGMACGYLFFGSYDMDWQPVAESDDAHIAEIKSELLELGFPAEILNDLTDEEIASCEGAVAVASDVYDHPMYEGRRVTEQNGNSTHSYTVYDEYRLRIRSAAVLLPTERESWRIFQHFEWLINPGFYGTECLELWPPYRLNEGWSDGGWLGGRVLYDSGGVTYSAPYVSLGRESWVSDSIFWGEQQSDAVFALFSLPTEGERQRGYVTYVIDKVSDGYIVDAWINYTHQQTWRQYPVKTAMDHAKSGVFNGFDAFFTEQDALQFFYNDHNGNVVDMVS
jgi:hypothetical protein